MAQKTGIGNQDFEVIRRQGYFYIDKTKFIREWWESGDEVTLLTRPRRFGKTLNMSMLEKFFSINYAGRGELFEGLSIWQEEKYRNLQGTYPVIFLSFANVKETSYADARKVICQNITKLYNQFDFLMESSSLNENEKTFYRKVSADMENYVAADFLNALRCCFQKISYINPMIPGRNTSDFVMPNQTIYTVKYNNRRFIPKKLRIVPKRKQPESFLID